MTNEILGQLSAYSHFSPCLVSPSVLSLVPPITKLWLESPSLLILSIYLIVLVSKLSCLGG